MSDKICPQCNKAVTDGEKFCSGCGASIVEDERTDMQTGENFKESNIDNIQRTVYPLRTESENIIKNKFKIFPVIIIASLFVLITVAIVLFIFVIPNINNFKVENINISDWEKVGDNRFKLSISSEQKKPFLALFEEKKQDGTVSKYYVYIDNGQGEITASNRKSTYTPIGYFNGKKVSDEIITFINTTYDFDKFSFELNIGEEGIKNYTCYSEFEFTINTLESGLLIFDTADTYNSDISKNNIAVVCHGQGNASKFTTFNEKPNRGNFNITFMPKYFIPSTTLNQDSYKIITPLTVDKKDYSYDNTVSYSGNEKIMFNALNDGIVLYEYKVIDGISENFIGKSDFSRVNIEKNMAVLQIYNSYNKSDVISELKYEMNIDSYLMWEKYEGKTENHAVIYNDSDVSSTIADNSKAYEIDFDEVVDVIGAGGYYCKVASDGSYLSIDTNPSDIDDYYSETATEYVKKANEELGFSSVLYNKMSRTRALDGTQKDENDKVKVSWTYHPNRGLEIIYEKK